MARTITPIFPPTSKQTSGDLTFQWEVEMTLPTDLVVSEITNSSMKLTWTIDPYARGYIIYLNGSQLLGGGLITENFYDFTVLNSGTEYTLGIQSVSCHGMSAIATINETTLIAVDNFHYTDVQSTQIDVAWNNVPTADSFTVSYRKNSGVAIVAVLGSGVTSYSFTGLYSQPAVGDIYDIEIYATASGIDSAISTLKIKGKTSNTMVTLEIGSLTPDSITFKFAVLEDAAAIAGGARLRTLDNSFVFDISYAEMMVNGINPGAIYEREIIVATGLDDGTSYDWEIFGVANHIGYDNQAQISNAISMTVGTPIISLPVVSNFQDDGNPTLTSVNLSWDDIPLATDGYHLWTYYIESTPDEIVNVTLPAGTTQYTATVPGDYPPFSAYHDEKLYYYFKIEAIRKGAAGDTAMTTATSLPTPPPGFQEFAGYPGAGPINFTNATQIGLQWTYQHQQTYVHYRLQESTTNLNMLIPAQSGSSYHEDATHGINYIAIPGLQPGTPYTFSLSKLNNVDTLESSIQTINISTHYEPPANMTGLLQTNATASSVTGKWNPVTCDNYLIKSFETNAGYVMQTNIVVANNITEYTFDVSSNPTTNYRMEIVAVQHGIESLQIGTLNMTIGVNPPANITMIGGIETEMYLSWTGGDSYVNNVQTESGIGLGTQTPNRCFIVQNGILVSGLQLGQTYTFNVTFSMANNSIFPTTASYVYEMPLNSEAANLQGIMYEGGSYQDTSVRLTWATISEAESYMIQVFDANQMLLQTNPVALTENELIVTNMVYGSSYYYKIAGLRNGIFSMTPSFDNSRGDVKFLTIM